MTGNLALLLEIARRGIAVFLNQSWYRRRSTLQANGLLTE